MTHKVAFLGLGVMGFPMAGHLSQAGIEVAVYNRTRNKAERWLDCYDGHCADTPAQAVVGADIVFACVGNDADVRQITLAEHGAFQAMQNDAVFVDHTTTSAKLARELCIEANARGFGFVDAPVSGGQQGADQGILTVMCGGSELDVARISPVMSHYARSVTHLGDAGSGQLCKMVNQICVAGLVQGLAEGLHFAMASGLDAHQVIETISKGAAQSWQMDNRHQTMLNGEYEHGFAVDWMRKDLSIVLDEAEKNGAQLAVTQLVDQYYQEVQAMGGGRWDTSSLLARLESPANNKIENEQADKR